MRALLARVAGGGGSGVMAELNRLTCSRAQNPAGEAITCREFAAKIVETREARQSKEAEAAAAKRQHEAELRRQHLASVMRRSDALWSELDPLMDQKIAAAYDQAAAQLRELRDAHEQAGDTDGFRRRFGEFRSRYSNRPAMLRRIESL